MVRAIKYVARIYSCICPQRGDQATAEVHQVCLLGLPGFSFPLRYQFSSVKALYEETGLLTKEHFWGLCTQLGKVLVAAREVI